MYSNILSYFLVLKFSSADSSRKLWKMRKRHFLFQNKQITVLKQKPLSWRSFQYFFSTSYKHHHFVELVIALFLLIVSSFQLLSFVDVTEVKDHIFSKTFPPLIILVMEETRQLNAHEYLMESLKCKYFQLKITCIIFLQRCVMSPLQNITNYLSIPYFDCKGTSLLDTIKWNKIKFNFLYLCFHINYYPKRE